jgi:hypothetical protein
LAKPIAFIEPVLNPYPFRSRQMKMKIVALSALAVLLSLSTAYAIMKYECWTYRNGKPDKMVHVEANNNEEAVFLAKEKFRKLECPFEYVKCK